MHHSFADSPGLAALRDELTGALIGLARTCASHPRTQSTDAALTAALRACALSDDEATLQAHIDRIHAEKAAAAPDCATCMARCGNTDDYDMCALWTAEPDVRAAKALVLFSLRGMAARLSDSPDEPCLRFLYDALALLGYDMAADDILSYACKILGDVPDLRLSERQE